MSFELAMVEYPRLRKDLSPDSPKTCGLECSIDAVEADQPDGVSSDRSYKPSGNAIRAGS